MFRSITFLFLFCSIQVQAQEEPIEIKEEKTANRISFYAINKNRQDFDVLFKVSGTDFRQSKARARWIRVPATSKVQLHNIIVLRGKTPKYTHNLQVRDSLSKRALKKPATIIKVPPKKIKPGKYIVVYKTENCSGCNQIIDSLESNNYIYRQVDLSEKLELKEQLAKSFGSPTALDSTNTPVVNLGGKLYNWIETYDQLINELYPNSRKSNNTMETTTSVLESFQIIGLKVKTINKDGQSGKDIKALWDRFFADSILQKIPNKSDNTMYNLYTNYESDHLGMYDCILGCKVSSLDEIPEGMTGITIKKDTYEVFTSKGALPKSVLNTWEYIWGNQTNRSYGADFDVYGPDAFNDKNATVKTYVSIK
ncbi:effector binding domain-containing protein [Spongiivirga sp. MCCC 1A20706]|uniref:effector binding domain-containing protein n=1 Tax=Spongiivirga sp. MCCC 1A20706 TaxID=3160963 RepID=UPI003977DA5F